MITSAISFVFCTKKTPFDLPSKRRYQNNGRLKDRTPSEVHVVSTLDVQKIFTLIIPGNWSGTVSHCRGFICFDQQQIGPGNFAHNPLTKGGTDCRRLRAQGVGIKLDSLGSCCKRGHAGHWKKGLCSNLRNSRTATSMAVYRQRSI